MLPDLEALIRLQRADKQIAERRKEIAELPKHIEKIEKTLDHAMRKLEMERASLVAIQKERKVRENEIATAQQKTIKLRDQLMTAKTNEQFRAFQNEIDFCQKEIRKAEDRQIELMAEAEPLEAKVKEAEGRLQQEKAKVEIEKNTARDRAVENKGFLEQLVKEREAVAATVSKGTYTLYERIRKKHNGNAIADGTQHTCEGCHMSLRPQTYQELKRGDQIIQCEACGRILTYNAPVAIQHEPLASTKA